MNYIKAASGQAEAVFELVQNTIKAIYPKYYPLEVVRFFCGHHSRETILEEIRQGHVWVLIEKGNIVGTGNLQNIQRGLSGKLSARGWSV